MLPNTGSHGSYVLSGNAMRKCKKFAAVYNVLYDNIIDGEQQLSIVLLFILSFNYIDLL